MATVTIDYNEYQDLLSLKEVNNKLVEEEKKIAEGNGLMVECHYRDYPHPIYFFKNKDVFESELAEKYEKLCADYDALMDKYTKLKERGFLGGIFKR